MRKLFSVFIPSFLALGSFSNGAPASTSGSASSAEVARRVESILGQMTLEEKVDLLGGVDGFFIRGVPRLGVSRFKMADGPIGVRNYGPATTMAGGIALTATWNPELAASVGTEIGRDARAKGVHFLLGPGANIYRAPTNGRNFEYYGEDPFLASRIAVAYIKGVQSQGVAATIKHFVGNNSEFDRHNTDSIIDERTLREIYLPAFEAAVKEARVGAIMDAYNLVNGEHMTQNGYLNTDVAKKEWGFEGVMMSDWSSTYDTVAAANGGLDLEMPSGKFFNRETLLPAIQKDEVSVAAVDDKVRRILRTAAAFGWLDRDQTDLSIPRYNPRGRQVALDSAREGMVLLKNDGSLLPLDRTRVKSIAVIGPNAYPAVPVGGGSACVQPFTAVSFLEGLSNALADTTYVYYHRGVPTLADMARMTEFETDGERGLKMEIFDNADLSGAPLAAHADRYVNLGFEPIAGDFDVGGMRPSQSFSIRWSGSFTPESPGTYEIFVQSGGEGGGYRLYLDDEPVIDRWRAAIARVGQASVSLTAAPHRIVLELHRTRRFRRTRMRLGIARQESLVDPIAKALATKADVVVVAVGFEPDTESEGADRTFRLPSGQDKLIQEMIAANKNTVVVITSGGGVDMTTWIDRVPSLIQAWYPGQGGGTALAEILFGGVNPSGRLPVTFERSFDDNPVRDSYYPEAGTNRVVYKEGVFMGYRGYEQNGAQPLFPFGHGLSYTTFEYGGLSITPEQTKDGDVHVTFNVTNTGTRAGADVAQVYVADTHAKVPRPPKELKGFAKVSLDAGQTQRVTIDLDRRSFSYFDAQAKRWRVDPGDFEILVGRSSAEIELRGKVALVAQ